MHLLQFQHISKRFSGVPVLREVSLQLPAGQSLGLVGENGAGKSTLMNILGGNLQADAGEMRWQDAPYQPRDPHEALAAGIAFVHQELNLFGNLSIADNLHLSSFPRRGWLEWRRIDRKATHDRTRALLAQVGLNLSPATRVEQLSPGERQLVEIAKALGAKAKLIILDEPTTSLTTPETEHLFKLLASLRASGVALIYISHNLADVLQLSDSIAVLRDGHVAGSGPKADWTMDRLVSSMVGRAISQVFPSGRASPSGAPLLEARGLSQPGVIQQISFRLHGGEVLGLAGLMGSGRSELARILFGLDPCEQGEILLGGRPFERRSPRRCIAQGMAFVTEDRREEGLFLEASIADNIALVALPKLTRSPGNWIDQARYGKAVAAMRQAVRLSPAPHDRQPVKTLSGGNQQKVVLAKWLLSAPRVFLLDEPTRGVDVGAKVEVYGLIHQLARDGAGVLVISSELEELIGLCDRILVMNQGRIRDELIRCAFDRERILRAALHEQAKGQNGA
ncbi:MAG: sugar ABC transporter ATP-binding protein [Verrucomicrobiota bacterium]